MGDEDRAQEGRVRPFFPLGCGWLGGLWADHVSSLGFITYHYVGANTGVSPDVRSRSRPRSLHVSQTLLRCLDRSVNCGDYECEVILGYTRKKLELLDMLHYMRRLATL